MNIEFKSSFVKDLKHVKDKHLLARVQATIIAIEQAPSLQALSHCKKLQGSDNYTVSESAIFGLAWPWRIIGSRLCACSIAVTSINTSHNMKFILSVKGLSHNVITFLVLVCYYHAGMAQSRATAPTVKSPTTLVDRNEEYPDAPRWACDSLNLLVRFGLTEPLPAVYGGAKRVTRYEMAVAIARLLDIMESAKTFVLPPLAQANADFYTRDKHGNWLPRYSKADIKATLLKLCEEFAPEIERLGLRGIRLDGYSNMERRDRVGESPRQAINNYFAEPVPQPAPKTVEAYILKIERPGYPFSPPNKTVVKLTANIALPINCQLTVLPTWSWQLLSVQWRATAHDAWGQTLPPYTVTLISPREAPTAHYECALQKAGQWQIKVQATVHYQTICGSGAAVATDYIADDFTPAETKPQPMLPAPPTQFMPKTSLIREARRLSNSTPAYPEKARRLNAHGTVILHLSVSAQGDVASVEVRRSSGYAVLDQAAQQWAKGLKYEPARREGIDVASIVSVTARFSLGD